MELLDKEEYMSNKNRRRRLNFSVKRQMQIRLFIKILGIALIGVGIMAVVFYFYSDREINSSFRQFHVHANNFLDLLLPAVVSSLVVALIVSIVITLFLPIKIAGPLFRIERDVKEKVNKGDLTVRFKLRKGDELGDLADSLNVCLETLRQKIGIAKKSAEDLEPVISGMKGTEGKDVNRLVKEINENLRYFKV
jgi:methyl-accepting chemotaxis protein